MREFKIDELHVSEMKMYFKCGYAFKRRYIDGIIRPPAMVLILGSAVHTGVEKNLINKIENKKELPIGDVLDATNDSFKAEMLNGVSISNDEKLAGVTSTKRAALKMALGLAELHHAEIAPKIEPIAVEKSFILKAKGFNIGGKIDVVEDGALRDTKTAKKSPIESQLNSDMQPTVYSMAHYLDTGSIPEFKYDHLIKTKTPKQKTTVLKKKTKEDFSALLARFTLARDMIKKGIFMPAEPASCWWCSSGWCSYFDDCPYR